MKSYSIRIGKDSVPVSKEVFDAYTRMRRHERYLKEADSRAGVILDHLLSEEGFPAETNPFEGYENIEEIAISNILCKQLLNALMELRDMDRLIIQLLYLLEKNEREVARFIGISRRSLRAHRDRILILLRRYMNSL